MQIPSFEFTSEEARIAASEEENERLKAENTHLKQRVVLLRAALNRVLAGPEEGRSDDLHEVVESNEN